MGGIVMRKIKKLNIASGRMASRAHSRTRALATAQYLCQYLLILVFFGVPGVLVRWR